MRLRTTLRISPVVWISPILAIAALLYTTLLPRTPDPYPLALTASATLTVFLVASVCAACAAWEGGRLRRAGWWELPHVRSPLTIAGTSLAPALLVGLLTMTATISFAFVRARVMAVPDFRLVAMTLTIIVTHTLLGFAIGVHVRPVIAVPAVLLIDYAWMTMPRVLDPPWLRHLNGAWIGGFSVDADVAPQALAGVVIIAVGLAVSAALLLRRELDARRYILAIVPTVMAFGIGAVLVHELAYDPVVPRAASALVCSSSQPKVCVWPEHRARLAEVTTIVADVTARWRNAGVAVPVAFSEQRGGAPLVNGASSFGFSTESRRGDIINALAYGMLPPLPPCAFEGKSEPYLAGQLINAWLVDVADVPHAELPSRFSPTILATITAVRSLPLDRQQAWLEHNLAARRTCDIAPQITVTP